MEMEVVVPVPPVDFNFDSACSSPYISAPSSPQRFGNFFFSAPASPSRTSAYLRQFDHLSLLDAEVDTADGSASAIPFDWEDKPGVPKTKSNPNYEDDVDFEFDFSGQLMERTSLSADELFDGGKIKPLKPPPGLRLNDSPNLKNSASSPRSPRSRMSPRQRKDFDPFAAAIEQTGKERQANDGHEQGQRGRERTISSSSSISVRKGTRSLSPFRVSDMNPKHSSSSSSNSSISSSVNSSSKGYRKWRLKDFLLFRSASEGRATSKDPLRKYAALSKKSEDVRNSSFRSTDSVGSVSSSRRRTAVSAHELHYTANRAVSEEMRKKTFLPYKHGLLGCLGFNHGVHEISRGIGSLTRG